VHGHGESAPQFGLAEQDETQPILGIHLVTLHCQIRSSGFR
jgi:hypothetical protein